MISRMHLKKYEYDSLSQLDRIEYRLRYNDIDSSFKASNSINFIYPLGLFLGIYLILILSASNYSPAMGHRLLVLAPLVLKLIAFGIVICIIADVIELFARNKCFNELKEEFFVTKAKPRRRK